MQYPTYTHVTYDTEQTQEVSGGNATVRCGILASGGVAEEAAQYFTCTCNGSMTVRKKRQAVKHTADSACWFWFSIESYDSSWSKISTATETDCWINDSVSRAPLFSDTLEPSIVDSSSDIISNPIDAVESGVRISWLKNLTKSRLLSNVSKLWEISALRTRMSMTRIRMDAPSCAPSNVENSHSGRRIESGRAYHAMSTTASMARAAACQPGTTTSL